MRGDRAIAIRQAGATQRISELIAEVESFGGQRRVQAYLESRPFPQFKSVPGRSDLHCKVGENGVDTIGRFVNRVFQPVEE